MNVVFDFGGVVFVWQPAHLVRSVLPHVATDDVSAAHWARQIFQSFDGDWAGFDRGVIAPDALARRIAARSGLAQADARAVIDAVPEALHPDPAVVDLLRRLREAGVRLYYLSNMPAPCADDLERRHAFLDWFDDGVFSSRVHHVKPEPAIFALAAQRFGRPAAQLVFIDDHLPNVLAARAAGWHALHFTDAPACEAELRRLHVRPASVRGAPPVGCSG